jgi:hypothetical protein
VLLSSDTHQKLAHWVCGEFVKSSIAGGKLNRSPSQESSAPGRGRDSTRCRQDEFSGRMGDLPRFPGGSALTSLHSSLSDSTGEVIVGAPWPTRPDPRSPWPQSVWIYRSLRGRCRPPRTTRAWHVNPSVTHSACSGEGIRCKARLRSDLALCVGWLSLDIYWANFGVK